ncbi:MFS transporter [Aquicella lusitana]|uniref:Putative MFS family arabinose efflux permease n=1 Tax=Aquicella lusitana TaxID=254246 RepID=A0A370GNT1_9COXI|nr:MFS transporter [Aquicella lusitana]RDI45171.1 putative MFS family arabinose efflux permease [Aquicella lusitana]VVC72759.1 Proline/betaine transporter [Aquicella lusitana]
MFTHEQKKLLFLSSVGGVLEFYDFIIYALLASYISKEFFPAENSVISLIATFATFSIGYLARPIGGILFGHFGDKLGRKKTFTISILMMALSTFLIGIVPSYATIGIAAPLILTLLRIFQGLSVGGEIPGAIAYVSESIPERKGIANGIIFCSLINGLVLGSFIQAVITTTLTEAQMLAWGWRIPFFIGGLFGLLSYRFRRELKESPVFQQIENKTVPFPLLTVFQHKCVHAIAATFIVALGASLITLLFLFIPSYLSKVLHISASSYIWYNTVAIFFMSLLNIFFGALADKFNKKNLVMSLSLLTLLLSLPIFGIYSAYFAFFAWALLASALLTGFAWGVIPSLLSELFPAHIRYSGVAVSYNLGFAIFGGLTPLIATLLIYKTNLLISPGFYLVFTALLCAFALFFIQTGKLQQE